jgi:hypothetical protein
LVGRSSERDQGAKQQTRKTKPRRSLFGLSGFWLNERNETNQMNQTNKVVIALALCMCLFGMTPARAGSIDQSAATANESLESAHTVSGTLAILDVSTGRGMLKTDLDKPIFFKIGRPDHFERLSIGDRVTMQLDEEGRTVKVIKALPAEVHEPPPPQ